MKNMNFGKLGASLALGVAFSCSTVVANQIDYASTTHSMINFAGNGTFNFSPSSGDIQITDGTAAGLLGQILGTYSIGTVATVGGLSMAPVSSSNGQFQVNDGSHLFSATLTWVDIAQFGTGGTLNTQGTVNLTGITYNGTNPDLLALKNAGSGIDVLTFQFTPKVSLSQLKTSHHSTSFSGSLDFMAVPDNGTTVALLGGAFTAIAGLRRKFRA